VLNFTTEIGALGSMWNLLHFCAKNNAYKCTEYVLKSQFRHHPHEYKKLINAKTMEGYTPLAIAIINRSHRVLERLFEYGGVDTHILDDQKMSPYEIAINHKNDRAIRLLMSY
jgi:ankyrin repeat protein